MNSAIIIFLIILYFELSTSQECSEKCLYGFQQVGSLCKCKCPKNFICPEGEHCELIDNLYCEALQFCPRYAYGCVPDCVICNLHCPYGLKVINGQQICECYWPCLEVQCPPNTICQPYQNPCKKPPCPWEVNCIPIKYNFCECSGDPHCYTFDHAGIWDNQITCEYIAAISNASGVPPFTIYSKNYKHYPLDSITYVEYVKIVFAGDTILFKNLGSSTTAQVNDFYVSAYSHSQYLIFGNSFQRVFLSSNGIKVIFQFQYFRIMLPSIYFNLTQGWCGNFDANPLNDKYAKNNYSVDAPNRLNMNYLAESWVSYPLDLAKKACIASSVVVHNCKISVAQCEFILKDPFSKCTSTLDPKSLYDSCVYDVLQTCSLSEGCNFLTTLAGMCTANGFFFNWRKIVGCPCVCADPNAECSERASSACQPTCNDMKGTCELGIALNNLTLVDVCLCKAGFYLFKGKCVTREQCGCTDDFGRLREINEIWLNINCSLKYTCNQNGLITKKFHICGKPTGCQNGECIDLSRFITLVSKVTKDPIVPTTPTTRSLE